MLRAVVDSGSVSFQRCLDIYRNVCSMDFLLTLILESMRLAGDIDIVSEFSRLAV